MDSFWDRSWAESDGERIARYIQGMGMETDDMMERMRARKMHRVCDAGCGCGAYTLRLAVNGFEVSGFDVSARAVAMARWLLEENHAAAALKVASVLDTGYGDGQFDAVICRDVLDHMPEKDAARAIRELHRIVRPGGLVYATVDAADDGYETAPHTVNRDGDYLFTDGKWREMVFHPYTGEEICRLLPPDAECVIYPDETGMTVQWTKPAER